MANNTGTLISAPIRPNNSQDPIASAYAVEIKGGLHTAATIADRNNIIVQRREWGMMCYVIANDTLYQLKYNYVDNVITNNANWVAFNVGSSGGNEWINSVITRTNTPPISPSNGDRYLITSPAIGAWISQDNLIAEYNNVISGSWSYTTPTNGMSVRVDDEDNSIYRYEGVYPTGFWNKENLNQVRFILATSSNGTQYTASSSPVFASYSQDILFLVNFATANSGTVSININNIGYSLIKKMHGGGIEDINANDLTPGYIYNMTYNGTYFLVNVPTGLTSVGVIGPAEDGDYSDGLFTDFTPTTPIGTPIDRFNEILKSLVPPPAPELSDWSGNKPGSVNGKLSFDANNPIAGSFYISATNSPSSPVSVDGYWIMSGKRLGIAASASSDITGVLNDQVTTHSGVPTPAYVADSFGDANLGQLKMYVNGVLKTSATINLTVLSAQDTTISGASTGFSVSAATASKFPQGDQFNNFLNRTGTWRLKGNDPDIVFGYNYVYVVHDNAPYFTRILSRYEFIIDHNTTPTSITGATVTGYTFTGSKFLSGIKYFTGGTVNYDVTIDNLYRNTYYGGPDAITFIENSTGSTIPIINTTTTLALANSGGNELKQFKISNADQQGGSITFSVYSSGKRRINESISWSVNAKRTVQGNTTGGTVSINNLILDNVNPTSTQLSEYFDDERYRLKNTYGSFQYDLFSMTSSNAWDSSQSLVGPTQGWNEGLQVINGRLIYPVTNFSSIGNITVNQNFGNLLTNYSSASGNRQFVRWFRQVTPTTGNFTMVINGSGGTFVSSSTPLTGNNIIVEIKAPGFTSSETGWLDAYSDFATGQWNDGNGCRNASSGVGRAFGVTWGLTIGTKNTANTNGMMLIRIKVGPSFTGYIDSILWNFT
jgi:hypothetical protein